MATFARETVDTLDRFHDAIRNVEETYRILSRYSIDAWYRGVSDSGHGLVPAAMRSESGISGNNESDVHTRFKIESEHMIGDSCRDSWDYPYQMQHHGIPARLPDWTESWRIATFFALYRIDRSDFHDSSAEPALWVLNPILLNTMRDQEGIGRESNRIGLYGAGEKMPFDYYESISGNDDCDPRIPMAILPPRTFPRVVNQKGCFTFHGWEGEPIETIATRNGGNEIARQIVIERKLADKLARLLELNQMEQIVFPDLSGVSDGVKRTFGIGFRKSSDAGLQERESGFKVQTEREPSS